MKKLLAILCTLASLAGALWFCMKFIARLSFCRKDHEVVYEWSELPQEEGSPEQEEELEKTK